MFVCDEKCISITSWDGQQTLSEDVAELTSTQEEADTKIIFHCLHVAAHSPTESTITVRSPDTDVFILLLGCGQDIQQTVLFDTGVVSKRRLIDVKRVILDNGNETSARCFQLYTPTVAATLQAHL